MYLVELNRSGKLVIEDDGIYCVPEFYIILSKRGYGEKVIRLISLVHDYYSPYRHRPISDRFEFVRRDLFGKEEKKDLEQDPLYISAVAKYKILQFDTYREELNNTLELINKVISLKNNLEVKDENLDKITNYMNRISKFQERVESLKKIISENGSEGPVKSGVSLYRLEKNYQEKLMNKV